MTRIVGLDVGYGFVKVIDEESGYSFPSVIGEGHNKPVFSTGRGSKPIVDDLRIGIDQKLYFVGKSAIRHSKLAYRDLSYGRTAREDFELLFFSALSLFCAPHYDEFRVVTGLPVERLHLARDLATRLRGEKQMKTYCGGEIKDAKICVSALEIVPQPLGTYWSQILSMDGDEATVAPEGLTGVIDIGFRTTDLAAIEDGEYIPEKSKTLSVGMATASSDIASSLATEYGLEKESYALDGAIIRGRINLAGRTIDISDIVARALERLAANVLVEIHSHWRSTDFDNFMLTGGGGQAVSAFLLPQLSQAKLVTDPVTANCRGYLAWGNRLWKLPGLQGVQKETVAGNGQGNDRQFS